MSLRKEIGKIIDLRLGITDYGRDQLRGYIAPSEIVPNDPATTRFEMRRAQNVEKSDELAILLGVALQGFIAGALLLGDLSEAQDTWLALSSVATLVPTIAASLKLDSVKKDIILFATLC